MKRVALSCALWLAMAAVLPGQDGTSVWNFPALVYGQDRWSVIKIVNNSAVVQPIAIQTFDAAGAPIPMESPVRVQAGETREVRLPAPPKGTAFGWANVSAQDAHRLHIEASVESIAGNHIQSVRRSSVSLLIRSAWAIQPPEHAYIYLLNLGVASIDATFCWSDSTLLNTCFQKKRLVSRAKIAPRQALFAGVGQPHGKFLITTLSQPVLSLFTALVPASPSQKTFSSESTLSFDVVDSTLTFETPGQ